MSRLVTTIALAVTCVAVTTSVEAGGCHRSRSYSSHSSHGYQSYHAQPTYPSYPSCHTQPSYHVEPTYQYPGYPYPGVAQPYPGQPYPSQPYPGMPYPGSGPTGPLPVEVGHPQGGPVAIPAPQFVPGPGPGPGVVAQPVVQPVAIAPPVVASPIIEAPVFPAPVNPAPVAQGPVFEAPGLPAPVVEGPVFEGPVVPTQFETAPPVVDAIRNEAFMGLPLQLTALGCGDVPGFCVLSFGGFEMPLAINVWQEGMIEVQMPTMNFAGATDATLLIFNADRTLYAELPLTLLNAAQ